MARVNKITKVGRGISALVWEENGLYVAQSVGIEVASQGETEKEALANLKEALELYFEDEKVGLGILEYKNDVSLKKVYPKLSYA